MSSAIIHFGTDESCVVGTLGENGYRVRDCEESLLSFTHRITQGELDAVVISNHTVDPSESISNAYVRGMVPLVLFEGPRQACDSSHFDLVLPQTTPSHIWLPQLLQLIESSRRVRNEVTAADRPALLPRESDVPQKQAALLQHKSALLRELARPRSKIHTASPAVALHCIMIADDNPQWRQTALSILEQHLNATVSAEVGNGVGAVRRAEQLRPDLILMDVRMPGINGIEATRRICEAFPDTCVVVLSMTNVPAITREALLSGARAYVSKIDAATELWPAVQAALNKKQYLSKSVRAT